MAGVGLGARGAASASLPLPAGIACRHRQYSNFCSGRCLPSSLMKVVHILMRSEKQTKTCKQK